MARRISIPVIIALLAASLSGLPSRAESGSAYSPEHIAALFFDAARAGRADLLNGLIDAGAPVNAHNDKGYTALILAAYNNHAPAVRLLRARGADPCLADHKGNTAQMGVAFKGHDAMARLLLSFGCDVDVENKNGQTAAMMAALFGRTEQVTLLRDAGADLRKRDLMGRTARLLARLQGNQEMVALLSANAAAP